MRDDIVDVRKLRTNGPDLPTQFESLLDCVWRAEKYERDMARIEANCRVLDLKDKNSRNN